jgi:hypothetical protein
MNVNDRQKLEYLCLRRNWYKMQLEKAKLQGKPHSDYLKGLIDGTGESLEVLGCGPDRRDDYSMPL